MSDAKLLPIYIYALINPITSSVFYVGATKNPTGRLIQHITSARSTLEPNKKETLIREIMLSGKDIEIQILDEVAGLLNIKPMKRFGLKMGIPY